jgi:hypothetical protein
MTVKTVTRTNQDVPPYSASAIKSIKLDLSNKIMAEIKEAAKLVREHEYISYIEVLPDIQTSISGINGSEEIFGDFARIKVFENSFTPIIYDYYDIEGEELELSLLDLSEVSL